MIVIDVADRPDEDLSAVGRLRKVVANEAKRIILAGGTPTVDDLLRGTGFSMTTYRRLFVPLGSKTTTDGVLRLVATEARYQLMFDVVQLKSSGSRLRDLAFSLWSYHDAFNNKSSPGWLLCNADGAKWEVPSQVVWQFRNMIFWSIDMDEDSFNELGGYFTGLFAFCDFLSRMAASLIEVGMSFDEMNRVVSFHLPMAGIPIDVYERAVESAVNGEVDDQRFKRVFPEFT